MTQFSKLIKTNYCFNLNPRPVLITSIELVNVRGFRKYTAEFGPGVTTLSLGAAGGKTTLREAIRVALSSDESVPAYFCSEGSSEWMVRIVLELSGKAVSIEKKGSSDRIFGERTESEAFFSEAVVDLMTLDAATWLERLEDPDWLNVWLDKGCSKKPDLQIERLIAQSSDRVYYMKARAQGLSGELTRLEQKQAQRTELEKELAGEQERVKTIEGRLSKTTSELQHAERIKNYIAEKRSEMQKIEFEIAAYQKILHAGTSTDFSEEEYLDLEKKARAYESLSKKIESIEEENIQRRHLEKNLEGIEQELQSLTRSRPEDADRKTQRKAYESEAKRIRKVLTRFEGESGSVEALKAERTGFQEAFHKFGILKKTRQLLTQNNRQKVKTSAEKLEARRKSLQDELDQIFATQHEAQHQKLTHTLAHERQQRVELQNRLEILSGRLEKCRAEIEVMEAAINKKMKVSETKEHETTVRKHLRMAGEAIRSFQESVRNDRWQNFQRSVAAALGETSFAPMVLEMLRRIQEGGGASIRNRFSSEEKELGSSVFQLLVSAYLDGPETVLIEAPGGSAVAESSFRSWASGLPVKQAIFLV